ncbi:dynamin family protein [Aerosakkonema funiforme]|uniref:dynamin family protein n=1 Tax=Aerosakkonema funiforme TaxID=1246630 RepID=UPI0035B9B0CE
MPINRDLLQKLSIKPVLQQTGIGSLPRGIHKMPGLREWVTLESVAFPPVPINRGKNWSILSLLAVPIKFEDAISGWIAPWGAVEWGLPEKNVVQKIDLRKHEKTALLRHPKNIPASPADANVSIDLKSRTMRENALFTELDRLLSTPPSDRLNLAVLAPHYAGLLPTLIYSYYHVLIPESREWLHPDVPAFTLAPLNPSEQELEPNASLTKPAVQAPAREIVKLPVNNWEYPIDLTQHIGTWLRQCLVLAESLQLKDLISELQTLENHWHLPGFRLAVVGEFKRGKSTLINCLLGRFVVPVGTLSTTAILISITAGSEDSMEVRFFRNHSEVRPVQESSWNDLLAADLGEGDYLTSDDREVLAGVQLTLDDTWLRSLDIELLDTPGIGDLNVHRTSLVFDLLNQCDAAVMVISAFAPFSMTEAAFLKEEIMGRHIDRILVVVSHLDTITPEQRTRVIDHIRKQVAEVSEAIPVLPLHPVDSHTTEDQLLDVVKNQIVAMVSKGDRRAWRSQQVAGQLADHLDNLIEIGRSAIATARMDPIAREYAFKQAQAEIQKAEGHWRRIRRELDVRYQQCYQQLKEKILSVKNELIDVLSFELSRTPNPKFWWERELPFCLRRKFPAIGRELEKFLMEVIAQDFVWLQSEVSRTFSVELTKNASELLVAPFQTLGINHDPRQLELPDIQRYRLLTRIGSSAAMIGGYVFGGPVGVVTNLAIALGSEQFLNTNLEEQRQIIAKKLTSIVDQAFDEHCQRVSERLHNLYCQLIEDTKHQQSIWQSTKNAAVQENTFVGANEIAWQQMIAKASALKSEIIAALG